MSSELERAQRRADRLRSQAFKAGRAEHMATQQHSIDKLAECVKRMRAAMALDADGSVPANVMEDVAQSIQPLATAAVAGESADPGDDYLLVDVQSDETDIAAVTVRAGFRDDGGPVDVGSIIIRMPPYGSRQRDQKLAQLRKEEMSTPTDRARDQKDRAESQIPDADNAIYTAAQRQALGQFAGCMEAVERGAALWADLPISNADESVTVSESLEVVERVKDMATHPGPDVFTATDKQFGNTYVLANDRIANTWSVKLTAKTGFWARDSHGFLDEVEVASITIRVPSWEAKPSAA